MKKILTVIFLIALILVSLPITACTATNTDTTQSIFEIRDQPITLDRARFVLLRLGEDAVISIDHNVTLYREDWTVIPSKDDVQPGQTIIVGKVDVTKNGYVAIIQSDVSTTEYTAVVDGTGNCPLWTKSIKHCNVLQTEFIIGDRDHNLLTP